jgi:hypothetical protein
VIQENEERRKKRMKRRGRMRNGRREKRREKDEEKRMNRTSLSFCFLCIRHKNKPSVSQRTIFNCKVVLVLNPHGSGE